MELLGLIVVDLVIVTMVAMIVRRRRMSHGVTVSTFLSVTLALAVIYLMTRR